MVEGIHNQPASSHGFQGLNADKVSKGLKMVPDILKMGMISATTLLPFSSRGIVLNMVRTPLRLYNIMDTGQLEGKSLKEIGKEMKIQMNRDWGGGISDRYTKTLDSKEPKHVQIAEEGLKYYSYMKSKSRVIFTPPPVEAQDDPFGNLSDVTLNLAEEAQTAVLNLKKPHVESTKEYKDEFVMENLVEKTPQPSHTLQGIHDKIINEFKFQEDGKGNFYDTSTGTSFHLAQKDNDIALCFHGFASFSANLPTDEKNKFDRNGLLNMAGDFIGFPTPSANQAIALGKMFKAEALGAGLTPVAVGFSHGGGLAQCAAAGNGIKGVVFNSRPMGAGARRTIGQSKVAKNAENMTAFSGKGDFLTNSKGLNALAIFIERVLGIPVPGTVGKNYYVPVKASAVEEGFVRQIVIHNKIGSQLEEFVKGENL